MEIKVYYDKECPFCNIYANFLQLKKAHNLQLINARGDLEDIKSLKKRGFDINNGFIVVADNNKIFQGQNAILYLNILTKRKIPFLDNFIFKNIIYPFIKLLRKIALLLKGKSINIGTFFAFIIL